ncbi:MAG: hypothetical protein ACLFTB_06710 [Desulfovibrionales bacterium]
MVYCAALMKEEGTKRDAGVLIVEITAGYLKDLEGLFTVPTFSLSSVGRGIFQDTCPVFIPAEEMKTLDPESLGFLDSIHDMRVIFDLPEGLKQLFERERDRHCFDFTIVALAPKHQRKMFSWRAMPTRVSGPEDTESYASEMAVLDHGQIQSLYDTVGELLARIR